MVWRLSAKPGRNHYAVITYNIHITCKLDLRYWFLNLITHTIHQCLYLYSWLLECHTIDTICIFFLLGQSKLSPNCTNGSPSCLIPCFTVQMILQIDSAVLYCIIACKVSHILFWCIGADLQCIIHCIPHTKINVLELQFFPNTQHKWMFIPRHRVYYKSLCMHILSLPIHSILLLSTDTIRGGSEAGARPPAIYILRR